jgi:hypothetical protein
MDPTEMSTEQLKERIAGLAAHLEGSGSGGQCRRTRTEIDALRRELVARLRTTDEPPGADPGDPAGDRVPRKPIPGSGSGGEAVAHRFSSDGGV